MDLLSQLAFSRTQRRTRRRSTPTTNGRLAQIWDTTTWNLDFPAEIAGPAFAGLRFQGGIEVLPTKAEENKKNIYAITTDGRLAQIWDTNQWNVDFPAELAGSTGLRF
jgi:hypothetical protein